MARGEHEVRAGSRSNRKEEIRAIDEGAEDMTGGEHDVRGNGSNDK